MGGHESIDHYFSEVKSLLDGVDRAAVESIVDALLDAWRQGKRVMLMGNGGSSSTVSHIVADLQKNVQLESGRALRTMCLSDCTPLIVAWANDSQFDNIFAPQVECWAEPGDIVIGVSGSGNSMNVINAIEAAKRMGAFTIGLAGYQGGKLKTAAEQCIVVESNSMQRIEDIHMILLHVIFCRLVERVRAEKPAA